MAENPTHELYCLQSTGKDSMVVEDLCLKSGISATIVFNNTTLDCADTYKIVNQHRNEWIITNPKESFYNYVKKEEFIPTRFGRVCCTLFKEGNNIEHFKDVDSAIWFMGMRNDESNKRANYEDIIHNPKWGNRNWIGVLPIRKWTELEIWLYTISNNLTINPKYKKGYKRCGCSIACPYASKSTWILDKYFYPKMYDRWHRILEEDFKKHDKWCVLNCTLNEYHMYWNGGVVHAQPNEEILNEFMEHKGFTDRTVAEQYFNKKCGKCGKFIRSKDTIAMNLKYMGANTNIFFCKKCLKNKLQLSTDMWYNIVKSFKDNNCIYF